MPPCHYYHFGLIVTGEGERQHLTKLFRSLMETGLCTFEVIRKVGQRKPITSEKRLKTIGTNKKIPDRDEQEIGVPARRFLQDKACSFVILVDDLEHDRREVAQAIFDRYRLALDTILLADKDRASVHFLVNMLEAYYFADAKAINAVLGLSLTDHDGDVETIVHPKNDLKKLYHGFDEIEDGGRILAQLDAAHVLDNVNTCAALRSLFAWCIRKAGLPLEAQFQLEKGKSYAVTDNQP